MNKTTILGLEFTMTRMIGSATLGLALMGHSTVVSAEGLKCEALFGDELKVSRLSDSQLIIDGFKIEIENGNTLLAQGIDSSGVFKMTRSVVNGKNKISGLSNIGKDKFAVEYEIPDDYYAQPKSIVGRKTIQILSVDKQTGELVPVQELSAGKGTLLSIKATTASGDILAEVNWRQLNRSQDWVLFKVNKATGLYEQQKTDLKDVSAFNLGESQLLPGQIYVRTWADHKTDHSRLFRVNLKDGSVKLVLSAKPADKEKYLDKPDQINEILPDVFSTGKTRAHSSDIIAIDLHKALSNGKLSMIGSVNPLNHESYQARSGKSTPLSKDSFVVAFDFSYLTGHETFPAHLRTYNRIKDLHIITIKGDKMAEQIISMNDQFQLSDSKAVALAVRPLNDNEFILVGKNQIQIVRKSGEKFKLSELTYLEEESNAQVMSGFDTKITKVSDSEFVVTDGSGLMKTKYLFKKINGRFVMSKD